MGQSGSGRDENHIVGGSGIDENQSKWYM